MPNYGKRYRGGIRISTGFVESSVNEIIARRMVKRQQMRRNTHTVQSFLDVSISRHQRQSGFWRLKYSATHTVNAVSLHLNDAPYLIL